MTITEFLEARIADDEAQAEACSKLGWGIAEKYGLTAISFARVLAECAAKRAIIAEWEDPDAAQTYGSEVDDGYIIASDRAVRALAAIYAGHEDYRQEWAA